MIEPSELPNLEGERSERASRWVVLAIVGLGVFMAMLDSSIVNISLPVIAAHFHAPLGGLVEWVVIAYLVTVAALLLTAGRLVDLLGKRPLWAAGLALFTAGSALCGAASSLESLIAFRAFQGVGGALLLAISPAMITGAFPREQRGRALGLNAVFVALGVSAGPTLGGVLTEHLSWRGIFYVNVPIGVLGFLATLVALTERARRVRGRFDPWGAMLLAAGLMALTAGLSLGPQLGWTSGLFLAAMAVAALALSAMVIVERRIQEPTIDVRLFQDRVFASACVSLVSSFLALFAVGLMMPFYLEQLRGLTPQQAGLLITPLPVVLAIVAPLTGRAADRLGTRWLSAAGLFLVCIGLLLVGRLGPGSPATEIVLCIAVAGIGQAIFQPANNSALMGAAPPERQGTASGLLATGRVVGQSLCVALAGAIFSSLGGADAGRELAAIHRGDPAPPARVAALEERFSRSFRVTFDVCAGVALVGLLSALVRGNEARAR